MQRIIVTADDYGMCEVVDLAIDAGIENGFITTTNVMLNMDSLERAKTLRARYPQLSIGVHWNVTTGRPVCDPAKVPSLVDADGVFWTINVFKKRYSQKLISEEELEAELEAQYALFEEACGKADYWNTHENSALHTKAFRVFAKVAKRHGVLATRTFQRVYYDKTGLGLKASARELLVKNFFELWFTRIRKTFKMPTARVVSFNKKSKTEGDVLLQALKKDGRDLIEVVFHPATTGDHPYFGNISDERVREYEFVSSRETAEKYKAQGIDLVGFGELR